MTTVHRRLSDASKNLHRFLSFSEEDAEQDPELVAEISTRRNALAPLAYEDEEAATENDSSSTSDPIYRVSQKSDILAIKKTHFFGTPGTLRTPDTIIYNSMFPFAFRTPVQDGGRLEAEERPHPGEDEEAAEPLIATSSNDSAIVIVEPGNDQLVRMRPCATSSMASNNARHNSIGQGPPLARLQPDQADVGDGSPSGGW